MVRSAGCALRTMFVAATCALGFHPAEAQWRLDAQAGRLQYEAAPDAITTSVALRLSRPTINSTFGAALGVPFSSSEPAWGALYGYQRLAVGAGRGFGIDLSANGFAYRIAARDSTDLILLPDDDEPETGWGLSGEAMPLVFWSDGAFQAEARAGVVGFTSDASNADAFGRNAFAADAFLAGTPTPGLSARLNGRFVRVGEGSFPYAGVTLAWTRGVSVWGSVGQWFVDTVDALSWDAGLSVPVGERFALSLNGRFDPIDPVYGTPSRTTWGAGVALWLGETARAIAEPVPASYSDGIATIVLGADDADDTPSIAGDFNQWTPTPMERSENGWVHRVALQPGVYNYAFVDGAGNWFVPEDTPGRHSDGMGGWVAVLVVEEPS
jgi:hypothetical protein